MKKLYIVAILLILLTMGSIVIMMLLNKVDLRMIMGAIVFMNSISLIIFLVDKMENYNQQQLTVPIHENKVSQNAAECAPNDNNSIKENNENDVLTDWNSAMYKRFYERWTNIFDKVDYPAEKSVKAEISVLSWEIASLTMDYLMFANNSPNLLERNKESVNSIIEGRGYQEMGLKQFYEDPTTIPAKVLAVYNTLSPQVAVRQSFETNIFGYYVEIPNK